MFINFHTPIYCTKGNLPHWHQDCAIQFITFRLADSLPQNVLRAREHVKELFLKEHPEPWNEQEIFEYFNLIDAKDEEYLAKGYGCCLLKYPEYREIVQETLLYFDNERYRIHAFVIMPNHVHVLLETFQGYEINKLLHTWKSFSAQKINKKSGRNGTLWMRESYDRMIRNIYHYQAILNYILKNPEHLPADEFTLYHSAANP